jgi:site-specific DNA-methyltransferase (adenine-specific)
VVKLGPHTLYEGDCLDVMSEIPDGSVDMVMADLPYGTTACKWDTVIDLPSLWSQYRRVCKPNAAIVLTACQPFTSVLVASNLPVFRYEWVWGKNKGSGHLNSKRKPMRYHEDVLLFSFGQPDYHPQMTGGHAPGNYAKRGKQSDCYGASAATEYGGQTVRYPRSIIEIPVMNNDDPARVHPTQKPVALMEYLLRTYSLPACTHPLPQCCQIRLAHTHHSCKSILHTYRANPRCDPLYHGTGYPLVICLTPQTFFNHSWHSLALLCSIH